MKKTLSLLLLAVTLLFTQCKKGAVATPDSPVTTQTQLQDEAISPQVLLLIQSIKNLPNQELKKLAFKVLAATEKHSIWADHIKAISVNYTPEQKALAAELSAYLSADFFSAKPTIKDGIFRDQWLDKAKKVFTVDQIDALAYKLYANTDHVVVNESGLQTNQAEPGSGGSLPNCMCASNSGFGCGNGGQCPPDHYFGDCKNPSSWGCGLGWAYSCDNICFIFADHMD